MNTGREIFTANGEYPWFRDPYLARVPDGSLCCAFLTGGSGDGALRNVVAGIRSEDDGASWSDAEVLMQLPDRACSVSSLFRSEDRACLFCLSSVDAHRYRCQTHVVATGADGRMFTRDHVMNDPWITERGVDIRNGTFLPDGRILLPAAWKEPIGDFDPDSWQNSQRLNHRYRNFGWGGIAQNNTYCVGVVEPNEDFTRFSRYGRICRETPGAELPCQPIFEPTIAVLSDTRLAMLVRGDMSNRLWRTDSDDSGRSWSDLQITDIPNPGSQPRIVNLPDGRIVLFHNPNEKDYDDSSPEAFHGYRTPLEMWVSKDGLRTWCAKTTLVAPPTVAMYPDAFYEPDNDEIYLVWESGPPAGSGESIHFQRIPIGDLEPSGADRDRESPHGDPLPHH